MSPPPGPTKECLLPLGGTAYRALGATARTARNSRQLPLATLAAAAARRIRSATGFTLANLGYLGATREAGMVAVVSACIGVARAIGRQIAARRSRRGDPLQSLPALIRGLDRLQPGLAAELRFIAGRRGTGG